ncbi:MAG: DUF4493 domain-containing protein [Bacteroides sp.]|nr:DUF4493 domain-containing protein [Bacteroides sp.]
MKLLHQCLVLMAAASLATSCSQEAPWSGTYGEEGRISLKLQTDWSVATSTRANDSESPVKPDGERFKIRLENSDRSYVKEWENLNKFNDEEGFPKGNYTVTAFYGAEEEQGFLNPYYVGTQEITVKAGEVTEHSITATLANSMVSIRYSESFINYFSSYHASLDASGLVTPIAFARDESRPCYVKPGEITVNFNIANTEGMEISVSPATFTAQPRRHYIVTANVKETETSGLMALSVEFEEDVVAETTEIILSDELYTTPAPQILASDFNFGDKMETFESVPLEVKPEFHVIAYGGIKEAKFTVQASNGGQLPAFDSEVDLVNTDDVVRQLIEHSKLNCYGFFRQPTGEGAINQMAVVDMKEFIENLYPGDYTFSLSVTDGLGRTAESEMPYTLSTTVNQVNFKIDQDENLQPKFMDDNIAVIVSTSYAASKDILTFNAEDADGLLKNAPIIKVEEIESADSAYPYSFRYTLKVDNINDTDWRVEAIYPKKSGLTVDIPVVIPEYNVEVDAFARRVLIKINPENPSDLENLVNNARFYWENGSDVVNATQISRDLENGIITITGLEPAREYNAIGLSYGSKISAHCTPVRFTTETETDVPNGDFSSATQTLSISGLQVGGQYNVAPANYTLKSSIERSVPDGWATINALTCWEGSSNKNTWFLVPSTYEEGGKATLRNVGYNHNGTTPPKSGGAFNTTYYCTNAPSDNQLDKAAGELFLGSYSYDGAEHRVDGISFSARPAYMEFDYEYQSINSDKGDVEVKVVDASGKIIAEGKADLTDSGQTERHLKINLTNYPFMSKVASLQVRFRSSSAEIPPITIPSGKDLNEGQSLGNHTLKPNTYHAVATGSVLLIDNVHLGYE